MNGCDAKEFISDIASAISHFFTNDGQDAKHHDLIIYKINLLSILSVDLGTRQVIAQSLMLVIFSYIWSLTLHSQRPVTGKIR
ncbi:hypothetical protein DERP_009568 [Dermatophagoides pteronyssinus]|uniref:Uncharacterized protein n=1 Tax=Dermatophagoides pteronyssinus TaxID=6956 RepID=A0ABQ8JA95_DERPT|nr:hypothetical protein DERP_009568 [Dermatophagoides pteronyssinus]